MPPLATIEIPALSRSHTGQDKPPNKGKAPARELPKSRTYGDGPLPIKPSDNAPKNARIVGRVLDGSGVNYQLKIGDVEINDVGVDEILDYVSALELEQYENGQFEEEREVLKVVEAERQRVKQEKHERIKERAKRKGVVLFESDTGTNDETEDPEDALGKHGRKRPTYSQFFKKFKQRRRLSDDNEEESSLQEEEETSVPTYRPAAPLAELPKRRRRKRDKITGELLPLNPVAREFGPETKRQRRRRHPLTGELMPVGWRYDPNDVSDTYERRRSALGDPSFRKLSISEEHQTKRQKLGADGEMSRSSSPLPSKAELAAQYTPDKQATKTFGSKATSTQPNVVDLLTSEESDTADVTVVKVNSGLKPLPKSPASKLRNNMMLQSMATSSGVEQSSEPEFITPASRKSTGRTLQSAKKGQQTTPAKTSILNPSATRGLSIEPPTGASESGGSEDDVDEDEFFIERILAHHLSNPKTHPAGFGDEPIMLYQVKWEGYSKPTWEPIDSFSDLSTVNEYQKRVGLDLEVSGQEMHFDGNAIVAQPASKVSNARPIAPLQPAKPASADSDDEDDEDEEEYEVEAIRKHHLSDPRSHPPGLGKLPVMLYQVKWEGAEDLTWEPAASFGKDSSILRAYNIRHKIIAD